MADMRPPIEFETAAWTDCSICNWKAATDGGVVTAVELGAVVVGGSMTEEREFSSGAGPGQVTKFRLHHLYIHYDIIAYDIGHGCYCNVINNSRMREKTLRNRVGALSLMDYSLVFFILN